MNSTFRPITRDSIEWATRMARDIVETSVEEVRRYQEREGDDQRKAAHRCPSCFYFRSSELAGQAFTTWRCGVCGDEHFHSNTGVPRVCDGCAEQYALCVRCGGDLSLRNNRRSFPPTPDAAPSTES